MTQLEQLVDQIKLATDYQINKRILREKIQTDLHLTYNGGLFKVTPELIAFVYAWSDSSLYIEDTYQNPIAVQREEFLSLCKEHYQKVMNTWNQQHAELRQLRKI
jgi:hypothetical protein